MFKLRIGTLLISFAITGTGFAESVISGDSPALPRIPATVVQVADFLAKEGNPQDNAKAIQDAINAAEAAGGGIVELPKGNLLSGPIALADNIDFRVPAGATLTMLPMDKYPGGTKNPPTFIAADHLHDIAISGEGTIEGQGGAWWPHVKTGEGIHRPRMIGMSGCERVLITHIHLQNSPMFHISIGGSSTEVTVEGVTIRAPASTDPTNPSHNTDACDVSGRHVLIENCDVSVGDDNFTCGGGTSDVHIRHCTYGNGHGVSIGSPTKGGVSDILVEDCTFTNTEAGIRIKSDRDRGGLVHNLTYRNLVMKNVGVPIEIYGAYMAPQKQYRNLEKITAEIATGYPSKPITPKTPIYQDITFSNIQATTAPGERAGLIWGLPEAPATHIVLQNVSIVADGPFGIFNGKNIIIDRCSFTTPDGKDSLTTANADIHRTP